MLMVMHNNISNQMFRDQMFSAAEDVDSTIYLHYKK